jgi:hypothetical protein
MGNFNTTTDIMVGIQKGTFNPNAYLSNMSLAYFQDASAYVAKTMFPIVPVQLSTAHYYTFSAEDLARDNVQRKPEFGKVNPAIIGHAEESYSCKVDQIIRGIDQIAQLNYTRSKVPASVDPRRSISKFMAEQMNIHQDIIFANSFFKSGVWENEWTGGDTEDSGAKQFIKFNDANFDPFSLFDELKTGMLQKGRRMPNKLGLGINAWNALKRCPAILDRISGGATAGNPAVVTRQLVAQMLDIEEVVVFQSTYNKAAAGQNEQMDFICDPNAALLCYATDAPAIDEPTAGYIFAWDPLGDGNYFPTLQWPGEHGTHSEFMEGLMAVDMKKTSDELGVFLNACV